MEDRRNRNARKFFPIRRMIMTHETTKRIGVFLGVIISMSTVIGLLFQLDGRWVKVYALEEVKEEMHQIDYRLD